ncbi:MAG: glycosyltransferase family 10 [Hoeflea sp.]
MRHQVGLPGAGCRCQRGPLAATADLREADIVVRCYDNWVDYFEEGLRNATPGRRCVWDGVAFTRDRKVSADWHVFFNTMDSHLPFVRFRGAPRRTIFAVAEPPTMIHMPWHKAQGTDTTVLTCDPEAVERFKDEPRGYVPVPSPIRSWSVAKSYDELKACTIAPTDKPLPLSWICSDEALLSGHRYRLAFLSALKARVPFDLYGRGFREIPDKWPALAPYRYSIAFENFRGPLLMTEKLMDCFVAETMPIYYGSPTVTDYFPAESMVIIDPDDPDVFRIIADVVASDRWLKNRDAVLEAKRITLDEMNLFARLARFIRAEHDTVRNDAKQWMRVEQTTLDYGLDLWDGTAGEEFALQALTRVD